MRALKASLVTAARYAPLAGAIAVIGGCGSARPSAGHPAPDIPAASAPLPGHLRATSGMVVVANKQDHSVSLLDTSTGALRATLPVGTGPHEAAASRDGRWAVIANYGDQTTVGNSLSVIDLQSLTVARTIPLGEFRRPHGIAFLPGDRHVIVTAEANQAVLLVDLEAARVEAAIPTAQPASHMLALVPHGRTAYTANVVSGTITEIDLQTRSTGRVLSVATMTEAIAVSPDGSQIWVGSNDRGTISVVDAASWGIVATLNAPGLPYRIAFTPDGTRAVVVSPVAGVIRIFDTASREEVAVIPAMIENTPPDSTPGAGGSAGPVGISISADGAFAYVALQQTNQVAVVDLRTLTLIGRHAVGRGPDGIASAPPIARAAADRH